MTTTTAASAIVKQESCQGGDLFMIYDRMTVIDSDFELIPSPLYVLILLVYECDLYGYIFALACGRMPEESNQEQLRQDRTYPGHV